MIDAQVINKLISAELVVADLSLLNPNAFYEIGIRHMLQKPIIHMHRVEDTIPFDVSLYRSIGFSLRRHVDLIDAREALKHAVTSVLSEDYEVDNPITKVKGRIQLAERATPEERVLIDQLSAIERRLISLEDRNAPKTPRTRLAEIEADDRAVMDIEFESDLRARSPVYIQKLLDDIKDIIPESKFLVLREHSITFETPTGANVIWNIVLPKIGKFKGVKRVIVKRVGVETQFLVRE